METANICSIDGCSKPVAIKSRQWCGMHYSRWRRHGDPLVLKQEHFGAACAVAECNGKVYGRGFCSVHYRRWLKHGDPLVNLREGYKRPQCAIVTCTNPAVARGWCGKHYHRWQRHGDSLATVKATNGSGTITRGYRRIHVDGRPMLEHRKVMEEALGRPLLPDEEVHHKGHKLDNRPEMLQVVSHAEHKQIHRDMRKTCAHGHAWTETNTRWNTQGHRVCKACRHAVEERRKERRRIVTSGDVAGRRE